MENKFLDYLGAIEAEGEVLDATSIESCKAPFYALTPSLPADENLPVYGDDWNHCGCGKLKPKKTYKCWRCTTRNQEFTRLDALIAAGYGSIPQVLIPQDIMESSSHHTHKTSELRGSSR